MQQLHFNATVYTAHGRSRPRLLRRGKGTDSNAPISIVSPVWSEESLPTLLPPHPPALQFLNTQENRLSKHGISPLGGAWLLGCHKMRFLPLSWRGVCDSMQNETQLLLNLSLAVYSRAGGRWRWRRRGVGCPQRQCLGVTSKVRSGCHKMMNGCPWKLWVGSSVTKPDPPRKLGNFLCCRAATWRISHCSPQPLAEVGTAAIITKSREETLKISSEWQKILKIKIITTLAHPDLLGYL